MNKILISIMLALVLLVGMIVPVTANSATITVNTTIDANLLADCTVTVSNPNSYPIYIFSATDMVFTKNAPYTQVVPTMQKISQGPPINYQTIAPWGSATWHFIYTVPEVYRGKDLRDFIQIDGKQYLDYPYYDIALHYPFDYSIPLPELASGVLLGVGLVGVGGFVFLRRKNAKSVI
jgi:hypothetical protein